MPQCNTCIVCLCICALQVATTQKRRTAQGRCGFSSYRMSFLFFASGRLFFSYFWADLDFWRCLESKWFRVNTWTLFVVSIGGSFSHNYYILLCVGCLFVAVLLQVVAASWNSESLFLLLLFFGRWLISVYGFLVFYSSTASMVCVFIPCNVSTTLCVWWNKFQLFLNLPKRKYTVLLGWQPFFRMMFTVESNVKKSLVWCSVGIIYCWFPARNWFHFHLLSNTRTFWNRWSKMNSFQIELERLRIFGQCRAWGNTDTLLSGIGQLYVPMNTIMQLQPEILKYTAQLHGLHLLLLITKKCPVLDSAMFAICERSQELHTYYVHRAMCIRALLSLSFSLHHTWEATGQPKKKWFARMYESVYSCILHKAPIRYMQLWQIQKKNR